MKNIEKTSVRLATSVFSESTRDALEFYANNEGKVEMVWNSGVHWLFCETVERDECEVANEG